MLEEETELKTLQRIVQRRLRGQGLGWRSRFLISPVLVVIIWLKWAFEKDNIMAQDTAGAREQPKTVGKL